MIFYENALDHARCIFISRIADIALNSLFLCRKTIFQLQ